MKKKKNRALAVVEATHSSLPNLLLYFVLLFLSAGFKKKSPNLPAARFCLFRSCPRFQPQTRGSERDATKTKKKKKTATAKKAQTTGASQHSTAMRPTVLRPTRDAPDQERLCSRWARRVAHSCCQWEWEVTVCHLRQRLCDESHIYRLLLSGPDWI